MTSDQERLARYVAAWRITVDDTVTLLRDLDDEDWSKPTDLPGWDVRAVAAHMAHLESELAGNKQAQVEVPELAHIKSLMGVYTEMGPIARADWPVEKIVDELVECTDKRAAELEAAPPTDGKADPPATPGGVSWTWETLLSNRALDMWMHEQDIRRAVGRPGTTDSLGAAHSVEVFARGFAYVVGKNVAPPPGTTVLLDVSGAHPVRLTIEVNDAGRAVPMTAEPDEPTVTLRMSLETFVLLSGGRRSPADVGPDVEISGDEGLGRRVVAAMAVTP